MYFSQTSLSFFILTGDLVLSLKAVFWMSRNAPQGALRDIPKTAARETRDLTAVCIFGHALKDD